MNERILIISTVDDFHAYAVAKALEKKGTQPIFWHTSDFPAQGTESIQYSVGKRDIVINDSEIQMINPSFSTIWRRRPNSTINNKILHPADQRYAQYQCRGFRNSIYDILSPSAFWVNPRERATQATSKIIQHEAAVSVGLKTPATLYSNDPERIREFIRANNGTAAFKPLVPAFWHIDDYAYMNYTTFIGEKDLIEDDILRQTPAIYQEPVPKSYELRITMMGKRAFGAKILSQQTKSGKTDWRCSYDELQIENWDVPDSLSKLCYNLLQKLGLVFGCFDFIVTPENEWIFLEVNQMGQFLFVENRTKFPLLDAFTEFLVQAKVDFKWDMSTASIKYPDLIPEAEEMAKKALEKHSVDKYEDESRKKEEQVR